MDKIKIYNSFEEINNDLQMLSLRRKIALEEIKLVKTEFKEDIQPYRWVSTLFSAVKKYGILYLIRRFFK